MVDNENNTPRMRPLAAQRGGPATNKGIDYQTLISQAEILRLLPRATTSSGPLAVALEPRVLSTSHEQVGFDIKLIADDEAFLEVKTKPAKADVVKWIADVTAVLGHVQSSTRFILCFSEASPWADALKRLSQFAREVDSDEEFHKRIRDGSYESTLLDKADGNTRLALTRMGTQHRPEDSVRSHAESLAAYICAEGDQGRQLLDRLHARVIEAARVREMIDLRELHAQLSDAGLLVKATPSVAADLASDVLDRSDTTCCVCRRRDVPATVQLVDEDLPDDDPANLTVLCTDCLVESRRRAASESNRETVSLQRKRDEWWQLVVQARRDDIQTQSEQERGTPSGDLRSLLRRHLLADFHWEGEHRGEFARLGGRLEDRFYQPGSGERLTARPAYYHTYWGLAASGILLPDVCAAHARAAADAIAERLSSDGWIQVKLGDYEAPPSQGFRLVETIRHTARAASILLLSGHHIDIAGDIVWRILEDATAEQDNDGGWQEFRRQREHDRPSLYASAYVYQLLASLLYDPELDYKLPEPDSFRQRAKPIVEDTARYLAAAWARDQWAYAMTPWQVNSTAIAADVGPWLPSTVSEPIYDELRGLITPAATLREPELGVEFDAPDMILRLRIAFAMSQLGDKHKTDARFAGLRAKLLDSCWEGVPMRTMDVSFLAQLAEAAGQ